MKKFLSTLLAASMLVSALPMLSANAVEGDTYFTDTRTVNYNTVWGANAWRAAAGGYEAKPEYKFTVGDETFSLLDVKDSTTSKYFVIADQIYGSHSFRKSTRANYFEAPTAEQRAALNNNVDSIAAEYPTYFLNGNFFKNGWDMNKNANYSTRIAQSIRDYIDFSHVWTCEPAGNAVVSNELYTFTAGITLPSATEINTYSDRFGINDPNLFTTRTMINYTNNDGSTRYIGYAQKWSTSQWYPSQSALGGFKNLRPVFWLNDGFFANVAVDLSTAGAAVLQEIKKESKADLKALYSQADLISYLDFTDEDFEYFADPITVNYAPWTANTVIYTTQTTADSDYVFTIDDQSFTLLDRTSDDDSKYFVIANQVYGNRVVHYYDGVFRYPTDEELENENGAEQFLYWLNETFPTYGNSDGGSAYRFNSDLWNYVDKNHVWTTEAAPNASKAIAQNYTFTAGLAIPSLSELSAYKTRYGFKDTGTRFLTRTIANQAIGSNGNDWLFVANSADITSNDEITGWRISHWELTGSNVTTNIRPVFYLNSDVFANVAVDLSTAGAAVLQEIKKQALSDLLEIYDPDDITTYLGLEIPEDTVALYNVNIGTRTDEDPAYGETLIANYNFLSGAGFSARATDITWKKVEGGETTTIGTGSEYIVTEADANSGETQIYFDITVTGATGTTVSKTAKAVTIPSLGVTSKAPNNWTPMETTADNADKFTLDGKSFTLIDSFNNDESTFFVTVNDNYGQRTVDTVYMDPTDPTNYAYWMNTDFRNYGNTIGDETVKLPQGITDYINYDHIWLTEAAPNNPIVTNAVKPVMENNYTFTAGIAPISFSELYRYNTVLGSVEGITGGYFTRTAANWANSNSPSTEYLLKAIPSTSNDTPIVKANHWNLPASTNIRPAFYLTKDFFKNVELEWDDIGENVMAAMKANYYIEDLDDLYDVENLLDQGFTYKNTVTATFTAYGDTSNIYETLVGAESLQANLTVETATAGIDYLVILALYDDTGALAAVTTADLTSDTTTASKSLGFESLSGVNAGYYAKLLIWNSISGMTPVRRPITFDSNNGLSLASAVSNIVSDNRGNNFFGVSQFA